MINERYRQELKRYYLEKTNRRLRYAAYGSIGIAIILMLVMLFGLDHLNIKTLLFLRGCVGLLAIIFIVLVGILVYRANRSYFRDKSKPSGRR